MIRLARRHGRWLTAAAAVVLVALLRVAGGLEALESAFTDARSSLFKREVASDIVIVGIDAQSLDAQQGWPWPRTTHARLLEQIFAAEKAPRRIFIDIDFSSAQGLLADAEFSRVLREEAAQPAPVPVLLPAFFSYASGDHESLIATRPLAQFADHATLVSVIREVGRDGLTRSWRSGWNFENQHIPSVIDPDRVLKAEQVVAIDYSISPASFQYISYVDLLEGRVDADALTGKQVFIGNVSVELGDMVAVPVYGSLPGVVVQALATETVRRGAPLVVPAWISNILLAACALLAAFMFRHSWTRNLGLVTLTCAGIAAVSFLFFAGGRILLEIAAPIVAVVLVYVITTLRSLDRQTSRALAYALGLRRRDALLKSIVQSSTDCIVCIDDLGIIRTANPAAARLFACTVAQLIDRPLSRFIPLVPGEVNGQVLADLHGEVRECEVSLPSGDRFPVEVSISRVRLRSERLFTAFVRDIRERKAQQRRLQHQATHDALTGLPNRAALMTQVNDVLGTPGPQPPSLVLMMLDLCRFKEVNDALGHNFGDSVLCEVAKRFAAVIDGRGVIARIGGDEFTLVLDGQRDEAAVNAMAAALADCLRDPIDVAGISIEVGVSIGSARYPEDGNDAQTLLRHADAAMYSAKHRGTVHERYDVAHDANGVRRLAIGGELRQVIAANALQLHFQPQVNLRTGYVESCEALVRWQHPVHGAISPAEFIAIAETSDLIRPLTDWTLAGALAQGRAWRERGLAMRIAVNLSARLLQDTAFPAHLARLLQDSGVPADALELEITESAMMLDPARALRVIQEVHRLGVLISIDDFGTGYSSLGYLRDLPVHALKLDKSFVMGMRRNPDDRVIVESTAQMAHAMRLELVAEGVEGEWEAGVLTAAGYDYAQGYLYSRALPADECFSWITDFNATSAWRGASRTA